MRVEIIIPDNTKARLKSRIADVARQLSQTPELVERIRFDDDIDIQAMFTPERLAKIDAAKANMRAGKGRTLNQLDKRIEETRTEWLAGNSS